MVVKGRGLLRVRQVTKPHNRPIYLHETVERDNSSSNKIFLGEEHSGGSALCLSFGRAGFGLHSYREYSQAQGTKSTNRQEAHVVEPRPSSRWVEEDVAGLYLTGVLSLTSACAGTMTPIQSSKAGW
jgi:hypothetical protein